MSVIAPSRITKASGNGRIERPVATRLASCLCLHDDHWFLAHAIRAVREFGPVICFVSKKAWNGTDGDYETVARIAEAEGAEVVLGDWQDESLHRRIALAEMKARGFAHVLIPDGDEVPEPKLLETLAKIAREDLADVVRVRMDTYWKDAAHVIRPREEIAPVFMVDCRSASHERTREYAGRFNLVLPPEYGVFHHLSYAGPDERIQRKISTWGHRHEVVEQWYRRSWKGWEADPTLRDLHPTHPHAYGAVERIEPAPMLQDLPRWRQEPEFAKPTKFPKVSVVIPLHGGSEEIRQCLESLGELQDLIHEVIVVDDASPDEAPSVAKEFPFVKLLTNETNQGFAATCNAGYRASTGDVLFFLNSDTVVPRAGLVRLIESLMESGTIGAAGPVSNNAGYYQRIEPTYLGLETMDLFATDLALSRREDRDVEMLVGFALAVKRSVLEEVGPFDERFQVGMFEDTDLCYRIARAGYRLRLATRAFVHHWGSRTLQRAVRDPSELLNRNGELYKAKWREDLESGFASHLPGLNVSQGLVKFDQSRHPDKLASDIARLKDEADISLTMIVRNEERVLGACLESAKPFFKQIVVVDTGSTDRTIEIARAHGAEVHEMAWPDSFAGARNESLKYAKGKWVFWLDADDTLPAWCGERILQAALNSPKEMVGYVVPVQFVDQGPGAGTRVDHVKLFRNVPGLKWEGRIHEQILANLRPHGEIARIEAHVLHSGYDITPEGQAKKRERDSKLLKLDLEDRPKHPFVLFNLGMTCHFTNGHEEAVEWLTKSIAASQPGESHLRKAYDLLGVSLRELGRLEEALATFQKGIQAVGNDPELRFQEALTYARLGRLEESCLSYEAMDTEISGHFSSLDVGILTFKRSHNLAGVHAAMGRYARARELYLQAIKENPRFTPSAYELFEAAMEAADYRAAQTALDALHLAEGPTIGWAERLVRLTDETHGNGLERLHGELNANPRAGGPRLVLARLLLNAGHVAVAEPHLQLLANAGEAEAAFYLGVSRLRENRLEEAIAFTEQAVLLNPGHTQSVEQLEKLRALIGEPPPSVLSPEEQVKLLTGPHAGTLGKGTKGVSVVIATYDSEEFIGPCLASVLPTLAKQDEVIVVDNASKDATLQKVKEVKDSRIKVIASKTNDGYAKAANKGILTSKGKTLILLNPDTAVGFNWITAMKARLTKDVGAVGPVSDNVSGAQFAGHYLPPGERPHFGELPALFSQRYENRSSETKFIVGMCLMASRAVLDEVGLLDENMVLGSDDLDLSWRLRNLGYKLVIAHDAFVHHESGASFAKRPREETAELIRQSDRVLLSKLASFYRGVLPGSYALFGCPILMDTLKNA